MLGKPLMPWQQFVADVAFEIEEDGVDDEGKPVFRFAYDEVVITVPRQSGKTTLTLVKTAHRLSVMADVLGPQNELYITQTRAKARAKLERDFAPNLRRSKPVFREVRHNRLRPQAPVEWRLSLNNGDEHIQFGADSYWLIDAPTDEAAHGDTLDGATVDEAWAQENDVEGGIRPAQATRRDAQLWVISTAGTVKSRYLYSKVHGGRRACLEGRRTRIAYFEWSAPDGSDDELRQELGLEPVPAIDPSDEAVWWKYCPALGLSVPITFLRSEWEKAQREGPVGIARFCRAYLNMWVEVPVLEAAPAVAAIDADTWDGNPGAKVKTAKGWTIDVAPFGEFASIGCSDGTAVDVARHGPGTSWLVQELEELRRVYRFSEVAYAAKTPAAAMRPALEEAGFEVREVPVSEHALAIEQFIKATRDGEVPHPENKHLDDAVEVAVLRKYGELSLWDRMHSAAVICPLVAACLARWVAATAKPPQKPASAKTTSSAPPQSTDPMYRPRPGGVSGRRRERG